MFCRDFTTYKPVNRIAIRSFMNRLIWLRLKRIVNSPAFELCGILATCAFLWALLIIGFVFLASVWK
jgi:hypothetical protein